MQTPSRIPFFSSSQSVLWRPTAALASVNAAITLSWIIYRVHLAGLLTQAGFPKGLAPVLLLIESLLAIVVEPWAGVTSDRTPQRFGGRFYIILLGTGMTALLFALLPGIVRLVQPSASANWWLPGLLIVWAIAISMFRSPALALLGHYAMPKQLPLAASLITLAGALAGSATPLASAWLLSQGATLTFIGAAILLLITVTWLKTVQPSDVTSAPDVFPTAPWQFTTLARLFGLGLTATLTFRLAVELFPKILKAAEIQPPLFLGILFVSLGFGALLAGRLATRWTNLKVMVIGLGLTAACLILMILTRQPSIALLTAVALGLSFSFIFNGTLPFVLNTLSLDQAGLSVGLFFGGAAAANSLYSGLVSQARFLTPTTGVGLAIMALLVAGFCILGSSPPRTQHFS